MNENGHRLMVIDHEPEILQIIEAVGEDLGFEVQSMRNADRFRAALTSFEPSLVAIDLQMPRADGIELMRFLARIKSGAAVVLLGRVDERVFGAAERLGKGLGLQMRGKLCKPFTTGEARDLLEACRSARGVTGPDLRRAIEHGELVLAYQPKALLGADVDWAIEGVEALVRWDHPDLGMLLPGRFLDVAYRCDLMSSLTDYVFRRAIEQAAVWARAGLDLQMAINLGASLLTDLEIPDRLAALVAEHNLHGSRLLLEISETAAMASPDDIMDILTRLRLRNIGLSLDDFGTAASSLRHLYRMPFTELKIDHSIVLEADDSEEAQTVITSIVNLGHNLGLCVCAEGVETASTLQFLRSVSCDKAQGHLISRPIPAGEVESFMRGKRLTAPNGDSSKENEEPSLA